MKTLMKALLYIACGLFLFNSTMESKTQAMNKDEIKWDGDTQGRGRSLSPIDGYVENGTVVLYLYEKPEVAKVTIMDDAGSVVYEKLSTASDIIVIETLTGSGEFEVTVEYWGMSFKGYFSI